MATNRVTEGQCYLCGKALHSGDVGKCSRDHVPPKQFYPKDILTTHNVNLLTLPVHPECNFAYKHDEDYFCASIACLADTPTGKLKMKDLARTFKYPEGQRLAMKVSREFNKKMGEIYLPKGKVVKRFDGGRVWRIIWKITRGLYYHEFNQILPIHTPRNFYSFDYKVCDELGPVLNQPEHGTFPSVFAYKYLVVEQHDKVNIWAFLLWNKLIPVVIFEHPQCQCEKCVESRKEAAGGPCGQF